MTFSPNIRLGLLSLALAIIALPASNSQAATTANLCKHLSPQKMAMCQQKAKAEVKKDNKKLKPNSKPLITPVDILMFLL